MPQMQWSCSTASSRASTRTRRTWRRHATGDKAELVHIAHRLRRRRRRFGFMAISEAAGRLEAALGGGAIAGPLATLTSLCRRARTRVLAQTAELRRQWVTSRAAGNAPAPLTLLTLSAVPSSMASKRARLVVALGVWAAATAGGLTIAAHGAAPGRR